MSTQNVKVLLENFSLSCKDILETRLGARLEDVYAGAILQFKTFFSSLHEFILPLNINISNMSTFSDRLFLNPDFCVYVYFAIFLFALVLLLFGVYAPYLFTRFPIISFVFYSVLSYWKVQINNFFLPLINARFFNMNPEIRAFLKHINFPVILCAVGIAIFFPFFSRILIYILVGAVWKSVFPSPSSDVNYLILLATAILSFFLIFRIVRLIEKILLSFIYSVTGSFIVTIYLATFFNSPNVDLFINNTLDLIPEYNSIYFYLFFLLFNVGMLIQWPVNRQK